MNNEQVTIGYDIYEKQTEYNHDESYSFVEDGKGTLYIAHYGHDGDQDWYITCFENVNDENDLNQTINGKYYYKKVGRVPFKLDVVVHTDDFLGKRLSKEVVNGKYRYGFKDYENNVFYILTNL